MWSHYNYVFYIEPEFDIESDGTRSTDVSFRDGIVEIFDQIIEKKNLKLVKLTGSVRNRINTVVNILEGR